MSRSLYGLIESRPGYYRSRDSRFRVERDRASGRVRGGLGYNAWYIFERVDGTRAWRRVAVGDRRQWETLRGAATDLSRYRAAAAIGSQTRREP